MLVDDSFFEKARRRRVVGGSRRVTRFCLPKDAHMCAKLADFSLAFIPRRVPGKGVSTCVPDGYEESDYERKVRGVSR